MSLATMGENIRRIRKKRKMSQQELAREAGIAQSTLSAIERNQQNPSFQIIRRIASALGCQPNALMKDGENASGAAEELPNELVETLSKLNDFDLQRVQDFAAGIAAARRPGKQVSAKIGGS